MRKALCYPPGDPKASRFGCDHTAPPGEGFACPDGWGCGMRLVAADFTGDGVADRAVSTATQMTLYFGIAVQP